jgi:hypothetical protein
MRGVAPRRRLPRAAVGVILLLAGCDRLLPVASVRADEPIDWRREPLQTETERPAFSLDRRQGKVIVQPRAAFDIAAVVARAEPYSFDSGAFLSPVDLVMTWGRLPEEPYRSRVSYDQWTRYYFWHTHDASLDLDYIASHSANMHLIPATRNLARALHHVGHGDRVRIRGLLVDVQVDNGFAWHTSMSRLDTGPGACELIWVEELQRGHRLYR